MRPSSSTRQEKSKSVHDERYDKALRLSRTEEEKIKKRQEWLIQQEREREHERLKRKMIEEYERKRAAQRNRPERRSSPPPHPPSSSSRRSKSRSRSLDRQRGKRDNPEPGRSNHNNHPPSSKSMVMSQKMETSSGDTPIFKGPEGICISIKELRQIKIDIQRNIPGKKAAPKEPLQRDILDPEDVIVKRRDGEGSKPIFEREEIKKKPVPRVEEFEEHRTVSNLTNKSSSARKSPQSSRKRSISLSPTRRTHEDVTQQSSSSSHRSRYEESKDYGRSRNSSDYRRKRDRDDSEDRRRRDSRDRYREKEGGNGRRYDTHRSRDGRGEHYRSSRSRDREDRDRYRRDSNERNDRGSYERRRARSQEYSSERRERDRSRDRRLPPPMPYIEQVPVPVYYGNFPPRPMMIAPIMPPMRGQMPSTRGRYPLPMGMVRPYPRFIPSPAYRQIGPAPNPRFGGMF